MIGTKNVQVFVFFFWTIRFARKMQRCFFWVTQSLKWPAVILKTFFDCLASLQQTTNTNRQAAMDSAGPAILLKLLPAIRSILEGLQQNAHLVEAGKQPDADITKLVTTFVDIMARCRAYVNSLDDSDSRSEQPFAQTQAELHQLIDEKRFVHLLFFAFPSPNNPFQSSLIRSLFFAQQCCFIQIFGKQGSCGVCTLRFEAKEWRNDCGWTEGVMIVSTTFWQRL